MSSYTQSAYTQMVREEALSMSGENYVRILRDPKHHHFAVKIFLEDKEELKKFKYPQRVWKVGGEMRQYLGAGQNCKPELLGEDEYFGADYEGARRYATEMVVTHSKIKAELTSTSNDSADKWDKLVEWLKDTKDEEDTDIWEFLEDEVGLSATGEDKEESEDYDVCVDCGTYSGTSCSCEEPRDVYVRMNEYMKRKMLAGPRSKYESAKDYEYRMECIEKLKQ